MTTLLGIDIGGTKIAGGLVDAEDGAVLVRDHTPTHARDGGPVVLGRALDLAYALLERGKMDGVPAPSAIGVGAGGQIDPNTGMVVAATDVLPGWAGTPLRAAFEDAFDLPTAVDNDVNALASGESRFGAGRGLRHLVFLALGTGVGGALIVNGRLHHGARGAGGELGHLVLVPNGHPCTCGGRGCLEQYASGPALLRHFRALGGSADLPHGAPLAGLARQDPGGPAARAIALTGDLLGLGLVSLANLFGPERFVIGGGLAALGDLLLDPARKVVRTRALPGVRDTPVIVATLGSDSALIGAATLAMGGAQQENELGSAN
jgi:glucokinase